MFPHLIAPLRKIVVGIDYDADFAARIMFPHDLRTNYRQLGCAPFHAARFDIGDAHMLKQAIRKPFIATPFDKNRRCGHYLISIPFSMQWSN